MVENKWQGQKWEELASEAQTGLRGQGAVVEAMRRLTDRLDAFSKSSDIYAKGMLRLTITTLWLTIVMVLLTIVQVMAVIQAWK
jgi:hypothetical protein